MENRFSARKLLPLSIVFIAATFMPAYSQSGASKAARAPIVPVSKKMEGLHGLGAIGIPVKVYYGNNEYKGTYLTSTRETGLAYKSGLQKGDVLINIGGRVPYDPKATDEIMRKLGTKAGTRVQFFRKTSRGLVFLERTMGWSKDAQVFQRPDSAKTARKAVGSVDTGSLKSYMYELVNADRKKNDLPGLRVSGKLESISRGHSQDMANRDYTDHYDPEGKGFADRAKAAGVRAAVGENVGKMLVEPKSTSKELIAKCEDLLMHSSRHRANLLNPSFKSMGIGMAIHRDGSIAVTQMFSDSENP